jgi:hypothetical protein
MLRASVAGPADHFREALERKGMGVLGELVEDETVEYEE